MSVTQTKSDFSEFRDFLEEKGWGILGAESLSSKLHVDSATIRRALRNESINRRSQFKLWLATGSRLSCFDVERTPLEEYLWEKKLTPKDLSKQITEVTGKVLSHNTIESISRSSNRPTRENCELLYLVTGLDFFDPGKDPHDATSELIERSRQNGTKPLVNSAKRSRTSLEGKPHAQAEPKNLEKEVADLQERVKRLERKWGLADVSEITSEQAAEAFSRLIPLLEELRVESQSEREEFIRTVDPKIFAYWVGMLSSMSNEQQFQAWLRMSSLDN